MQPVFNDSILKPRPFYHTGFEESLERIVLDEKPKKNRDIVDRVFSDKGRILKATIKALFNEILIRERLDEMLLSDIDEDMCRQHSHLEMLSEMNRHNYSFELLNDFTDRKFQIEKNVLELQQDRRKEHLECWRDLLFLKKYLLSALKDYWNLSSNRAFLDIEDGVYGRRSNVSKIETYSWK